MPFSKYLSFFQVVVVLIHAEWANLIIVKRRKSNLLFFINSFISPGKLLSRAAILKFVSINNRQLKCPNTNLKRQWFYHIVTRSTTYGFAWELKNLCHYVFCWHLLEANVSERNKCHVHCITALPLQWYPFHK